MCEEQSKNLDNIELHLGASGLKKMDFFGSADPYLVIYRSTEDGSWVPVHKTEILKNTLTAKWKPFTISSQKLCNGDPARPLLLKVFDWDRNSDDELIGEAQ
eukprot:578660_1